MFTVDKCLPGTFTDISTLSHRFSILKELDSFIICEHVFQSNSLVYKLTPEK